MYLIKSGESVVSPPVIIKWSFAKFICLRIYSLGESSLPCAEQYTHIWLHLFVIGIIVTISKSFYLSPHV